MQKTGKSIVIIGGGIAGLSAGCYARMNGFRAQIERHDKPGGLCTAWTRRGYTSEVVSTTWPVRGPSPNSTASGKNWALRNGTA